MNERDEWTEERKLIVHDKDRDVEDVVEDILDEFF